MGVGVRENTYSSFLPNDKSQALKALSAKFQPTDLVNWNIISFFLFSCPVGWASPRAPKDSWFDSLSGHVPRLWDQSPHARGMRKAAEQCFSSLSLPSPLKIHF